MPTALEQLLLQVSKPALPKELPSRLVIHAMKDLGYGITISGSHHKFKQRGWPTIVMAIHGKRVPLAAIRDLRDLLIQKGLL